MSDARCTIICNALVDIVFIIGVVVLATHFNRIGLCWWFVLTPFLGMSYKSHPVKEDKDAT